MRSDEWETCADVSKLYDLLPKPIEDRKMRLWAVACARFLVHTPNPSPRYDSYHLWLSSPKWEVAIESAELYADGVIDRATLIARRALDAGGPHNAFLWMSKSRHFSHTAVIRSFSGCRDEFQSPSAVEMMNAFRDIFNPFRPIVFADLWRSESAVALARAMYESRNFSPMPVLADALEEAGCDSAEVLRHCRGSGPHVRGCWVVDGVLGKQ